MIKFKVISIVLLVSVIHFFSFASEEDIINRFIDNNDGTITDTLLNVMWAQTDNQGDINWRQAQKWVQFTFPYTLATTYSNWRLPTVEELESLYDRRNLYDGYETECGHHVKIVSHIKLSCGWVWAAEMKMISARLYNFNRGYSYTDRVSKNRAYRVLAIRNLSE